MARSLELLNHHTQTLQSIRGIVRTMKTMSAINAQPYERSAHAIERYYATVLQGLQAFLHSHGPLLQETQPGALPVIIAFGSDHGLCGNYNEILATEVARHLVGDRQARVLCVGAQMEDALIGLGTVPESVLLPPATVDGLGRLAGDLVTRLDGLRNTDASGDIEVTLVYTQRENHGHQNPVSQRLLPLDPTFIEGLTKAAWPSHSLPQFNLPADDLLAELIRGLLFSKLIRAAAEALVTENAARLARMQQAEQSVDERLEDLTMETRSVRQSEITTELLDVIIGFEALTQRIGGKRRQTS